MPPMYGIIEREVMKIGRSGVLKCLAVAVMMLLALTPVLQADTSSVTGFFDPLYEDETITFTLETAFDINVGNITEVPVIVNISTNNTRIKNETILFARTASYDATAKNASFMVPSNPVAPNLIRGHGRNLGYWFEEFNDSGTGELGGMGEWSCGALPNSSKFTVLNYGDNWTRVQVLPCSCALFPKFWYLDRKQMMHETKTDQYSPIYSQNILKTEFNLTGITSDEYAWNNNWLNATHHIFFYANATSGYQPLNVWYANESYTTGNPTTSPYCVFLGSVTPGEDYSYSLLNSKYYNITFSTNNGSIGGIGITAAYYFIFSSDANYDDAWKLYYADGNETVGTGYFDFLNTSVAQVSTNNGSRWVCFGNDTCDDSVLWLKFDEGAGDNLVDSSEIYSGHYHNGTRQGATWNASGHEGACLDFNGTTDYVNVTNDPDGHLNFTTEMTVSCLINPANLAPYDYWISKEDSFRFGTSNNKNRPRFGFYRGGWKQESTGNDYLFDGDTWYHVAVTFNSTEPETVVMYVNGTEVHRQSGFAGTGNMESGIGDIYIGTRYGITAGWSGSIDDVRLWNRTLSPDEIYDVYANVTRKGCPDVNFNVGNPENDRIIYKFYAELEDGSEGTWSQEWYDVLGDVNFPPASLSVVSPQVNGTYYALDNQTILFEWLGDPNYDDCWINTTIEYSNGTFINWYNNRSIPGWYQKQNTLYTNYLTPSNYSLKAGDYKLNVTITDNQSATTNNIFGFKVTELNITSPSPTDQSQDVAVPLDYFAITINHSYGESFNITWKQNNCTGTIFNTTFCTSNGTYYAYNTSWVENYTTDYRWAICVNETSSIHWLNKTYVFETQDGTSITGPYPTNQSIGQARPPVNLSAYINGTNLDITIKYINITGTTNSIDTLATWTGETSGYFSVNPLANATLTTQFLWGNTIYYWYINVTDGSTWFNESYYYTTTGSRYDIDNSTDVVATDVTVDWQHRFGEKMYDGIYDVDGSGDITATDASIIWQNRT